MKTLKAKSPFTRADPESRILYHHVPLDDGRTVALFVNRNTNLVVLNIQDADEEGGTEVYRSNV